MNDLGAALRLDVDLARRTLVAGLRAEFAKFGFRRAVAGLSGGVDSATSCYLAVEALGAENVLAVLMPYRTSSPASEADAHRVIEALGIPWRRVDITPQVDPYLASQPEMGQRRCGNLMARTRMIILYDLSEEFEALVLGASNKSELLLGYGTLCGDMASAVNPLGDLYKTQVRQLAAALGVPREIVAKAPTADLWPGQTDESELGFTYEQADRLLYLLIDRRYRPEEAIEAGFAPAFVERVCGLIQANQFKRVGPVILKLSGRSMGHDFLYPRDWGR